MSQSLGKGIIFIALACIAVASHAAIIVDNGTVDPGRTTWNSVDPVYTIFDDFVLSDATLITRIDHTIFMPQIENYSRTFVSVWDGIGADATDIVAEFAAVGDLTANGLTTNNAIVPNGFDVVIDNLAMHLAPGIYFLGIRTDTVTGAATIGSGAGGVDTIGPGLFQAMGTDPTGIVANRVNDHFAFRLQGTVVLPEPGTLALIAAGLLGVCSVRRRKSKA